MNLTVTEQLLRGSRWVARPDSYSHLVGLQFLPEGRTNVTLGHGQTLFFVGSCQHELVEPTTLRLIFDSAPKHSSRSFTFTPGEVVTLSFVLEQGEFSGMQDIVPTPFAFLWCLRFAQPPFPSGVPYRGELPTEFFGYSQPPPASA